VPKVIAFAPATRSVVPVTARAVAVWLIGPVVVTDRFPPVELAPNSIAPPFRITSFKPVFVKLRVDPKLFATVSRVIAFAPATRSVVPVTARAVAVWLIGPVVVTDRFPPVELAPNSIAPPFRITLFKPVFVKLRVDPKLFATVSRMIVFAPATRSVVPATERAAAVWLIGPVVVTDRFPPVELAPNSIAPPFRTTSFKPVFVKLRVDPKLFATVSRVIVFAPATRSVVPATERAVAVWLIGPVVVTDRFPPVELAPNSIAPPFRITSFKPVFVKLRVDPKLFATVSRVIVFAPAARVVVPVTARAVAV
jgi:hypothetical protein